jgi:hypothetical protein
MDGTARSFIAALEQIVQKTSNCNDLITSAARLDYSAELG